MLTRAAPRIDSDASRDGRERDPFRIAEGVILAGLLVRAILAGTLLLAPEEAYHWNFGQHPDLGYLDHPPMMAWLSALTTALFGRSEWAVRLGPILFGGGAAWLLADAARRLFSARAALYTTLIWAVLPVSTLASVTLMPDNPLIFGWSLALWGLVLALWGERPVAGWLAAGAGMGMALLGKYTAGMLLPSAGLFLLLSRAHRRHLATPWPWLALLTAAAIFSPVLVWNAQHDWASFRFQFARRVAGFQLFSLPMLLKFASHQALAASPVLVPAFLLAAAWGVRRAAADGAKRLFLCCLAFPTLLAFAYSAARGASHFIWTFPAYAGWTMLVGAWLEAPPDSPRPAKRPLAWAAAGLTAAGLLAGWVHATWALPLVRPLEELRGWPELARRAERERAKLGNAAGEAFLIGFGRRFTVESELAFYTGRPDLCHGKNLLGEDGLQYAYWADPKALRGRNAVVVIEPRHPDDLKTIPSLDAVKRAFDGCEVADVMKSAVDGRNAVLIRAFGYRTGGTHGR